MFGKLSKQTTNETEIELEMGAKGGSKNIWTVEQLREELREQSENWQRELTCDDGINVSRTVIRGCQAVSLDG